VTASRIELVLGAPLGRQLLFDQLGFLPDRQLFDRLSLGPVPGTGAYLTTAPDRAPRRRRPPPMPSRRWTEVSPGEAASAVRQMVERREWEVLPLLDALEMLALLARATYSFGFHGADESVWGLTGLAQEELRPVAEALLGSPAAADWWDPVARADQRHLQWEPEPFPRQGEVGDVVEADMSEERLENESGLARGRPEEQPGVRIGAHWWSTPRFTSLTATTPPIGDIAALGLGCWVDVWKPFGHAEATVWAVEISSAARVLEISEPDDWRTLVENFPRDVTGTNDGEWRSWTGRSGPWRLPDWERVATRYDGVHVTIGGYLSTSGLGLPAAGGYTVLAGWVPGETLWLRDVSTHRERVGRWKGRPRHQGWDDVREGWRRGA
jgi:hypothetical protein